MTTIDRADVRERARLDELAAYRILDTEPEAAFDAIAPAAALVAGVPVAAVGLIDDRREWFKAAVGMDPVAIDRESSLCDAAVQAAQPLVVADAALASPQQRLASLSMTDVEGRPLAGPDRPLERVGTRAGSPARRCVCCARRSRPA